MADKGTLGLEDLLRYGIPGSILVFPLVFLTHLYFGFLEKNEISNGLIFLLIFASVPIGYILHQLWFLLWFDRDGKGYEDPKLLHLKYIRDELKFKDVCDEKDKEEISYLCWARFTYSEKDEERQQIGERRIWQFYHSFISSSLSLFSGVVLWTFSFWCARAWEYTWAWKLLILAAIYLALAICFYKKSRQTKEKVQKLALMTTCAKISKIKKLERHAIKAIKSKGDKKA